MSKSVFILGAGASASAHLPTQAGLLSQVFSISQTSFIKADSDSFLSLPINEKLQRMQRYYQKFNSYRRELGRFIVSTFASMDKEEQFELVLQHADSFSAMNGADALEMKEAYELKAYEIVQAINVTLEDLFTIFDNVDAGREHFKLYSPKHMSEIHNMLKLCIIYVLSYALASEECCCDDYRAFSKFLIEKRIETPQKADAFSVITMNWDNLFERILFSLCTKYNASHMKSTKLYPDLCFYNYALVDDRTHIPSTLVKAKGYKNIKILKMHGSLAWLECPRCGRIFTDFSDEIAAEEFEDIVCPNCSVCDCKNGEKPILRSLIITPTFMKTLNNLNIKNIWHNAYLDLSEADHLIFIGYSFPDADFEMRCLLKKAVKKDAKISVVLTDSSNPQSYLNDFFAKGYNASEAKKLVEKMYLPSQRYVSFFGEGNVDFFYNGFSAYLNNEGG